jgi:hypothetical protein
MIKQHDLVQQLLVSPLATLLRFLQMEPGFFEATDKQKTTLSKILSAEIRQYMIQVQQDLFLKELGNLFLDRTQENKLAKALVQDICHDLLGTYDFLPDDFGILALAQKKQLLEKIAVVHGAADVLLNYGWQEIELAIQTLVNNFAPELHIVIIEIPTQIPDTMRAHMRNKYRPHIVFFHLNPTLLGGLRILENGKIFDYSWSGKIQQWANQSFSL